MLNMESEAVNELREQARALRYHLQVEQAETTGAFNGLRLDPDLKLIQQQHFQSNLAVGTCSCYAKCCLKPSRINSYLQLVT